MAGLSQTLEHKIGPENFAVFRRVIEEFKGVDKANISIAAIRGRLSRDHGLSISRSTIREYLDRGFSLKVSTALTGQTPNQLAPFAPGAVTSPVTPAVINNSILLRENARLKRQLAEREAGWEIIRETLQEVYAEPLNIEIQKPKTSELPGSPEVAVVSLGDIHYAKTTDSYNVAVCESRVQQVFTAVSEITELRRKAAPIDECILVLLGDMIEGSGIFPSQAYETSVDLITQMVKSGPEYCVNFILSLLQIFPTVRIHGVVGNHGRIGKFQSDATNADSVYYEIVRKMVSTACPEDSKRIVWDLPLDRGPGQQWYSRFDIIGRWSGMAVHGDQLRGGFAGMPWYAFKTKIAGWNTTPQTAGFTHLWSGHFHTPASFRLNRVHVLANGSTESDNQYSLENMSSSGSPCQRVCYFNERYGMLADQLIHLD